MKKRKSENTAVRMEEDKEMCKDVVENSLGLEESDYKIVKVIRLGKKREEGAKPRPMLIKLEEEEQKWNIIKNARNLKDEMDLIKKNIGISRDMTVKEREQDFNLRQQLKEKIRMGELGWYIKNRELIKGRAVRRRN